MRYKEDEAIALIEERNRIKFSEEQLKILNHQGGMYIVSCAGSGKTTVLVELVTKRIMTGEIANVSKLLLTTYSKSGATTMTERINKQLEMFGLPGKVQVKTMHAFYLQVLRVFGDRSKPCGDTERYRFIRQACKEIKFKYEEEDIENLANILSVQINSMLTDKDIYSSYIFNVEITLEQYTEIRTKFSEKKIMENLMDFDDMQYRLYVMLARNERGVIAYCKEHWNEFYVDEFQDTNRIQFEILKRLIDRPDQLNVIGDDDQCIYSWRGADPSIIINICAYFDIKKFYLSTNYRCKEKILRFAETGVKFMYNREKKEMIPFKSGGTIEFLHYSCKDLYGMELATFNYIKDRINDGVSPNDMCVIVRNNAHAAVLSNMLTRNGIYCDCGKEIKISTSNEFRDLEKLVDMAGEEGIPQTYDKDVCCAMLWKLVSYMGVAGGNVLYEFMDNTSLNLYDALQYILCNYTIARVQCDRRINLPKKVELKISTKCMQWKTETVSGLCALYEILGEPDHLERLKKLIILYKSNMDFTLKDPNRRRVFEAFFKYVESILSEGGLESLNDIMNAARQYEKSTAEIDTDKVRITTAHSSKGMEWQHVIMMAYDNISFPPFKYLLDSLEKGVGKDDLANYIDGERRLSYVAMTRAIDRLTIVGDFDNFSIFGLESLGVIEDSSIDKVIGWANKIKFQGKLGEEMRINGETTIKGHPNDYKLIRF